MNKMFLNKKYQIIKVLIISILLLMVYSSSCVLNVYASSNSNLKIKSYEAYYDFLMDESNNIGKPIKETSLYQKDVNSYMGAYRTSTWTDKKITAAYLLDVTGDGIEDLIIRKLINMPVDKSKNIYGAYDDILDIYLVYTYRNGKMVLIGHSQDYSFDSKSMGIGCYLSDEYPFYCVGSDGVPTIATDDYYSHQYGNGHTMFYKYQNGQLSYYKIFQTSFIHDFYVNKYIHSSTGHINYYENYAEVSESKYYKDAKKMVSKKYIGLVCNDYHNVLYTLKKYIPSYADHYYSPSSWATADVQEAISSQYVPNELKSKYAAPITRKEFCALAAQFYEANMGTITATASFTDTNDMSVKKMASIGIINGTGNGKFSPDKYLTRQEAATILDKLSTKMGRELNNNNSGYHDSSKISTWAKDSVNRVVAAGIMNGTGNGNFSPLNYYTREQSISTIMRLSSGIEDVREISLNKNDVDLLKVGDSFQLEATIRPQSANNKELIWTSSDPNIVSVDSTGKITATGKGTAIISVAAPSGITASSNVIVHQNSNFKQLRVRTPVTVNCVDISVKGSYGDNRLPETIPFYATNGAVVVGKLTLDNVEVKDSKICISGYINKIYEKNYFLPYIKYILKNDNGDVEQKGVLKCKGDNGYIIDDTHYNNENDKIFAEIDYKLNEYEGYSLEFITDEGRNMNDESNKPVIKTLNLPCTFSCKDTDNTDSFWNRHPVNECTLEAEIDSCDVTMEYSYPSNVYYVDTIIIKGKSNFNQFLKEHKIHIPVDAKLIIKDSNDNIVYELKIFIDDSNTDDNGNVYYEINYSSAKLNPDESYYIEIDREH